MRLIAALLLALLPAAPGFAQSLTIAGGETVTVPGTDVQVQVTEVADGRCPADADCVWEGLVEVGLLVHTGSGDWVRASLCNHCDHGWHEALVRGWIIGFQGIEPDVEALARLGREPRLEDYRVMLTVEPR